MAQTVFEENEDHFSEIKNIDDEILLNNLMKLIDDYSSKDDNIDDSTVQTMITDIQNKISVSKSSFFDKLSTQLSVEEL